MKKSVLMLVVTMVLVGCTNVLDKPMSNENLLEVKEIVLSDKTRSSMKNKYLLDKLSEQVGFMEMGKAMIKLDDSKLNINTFRTEIGVLSSKYDSIKKAKELIKKNNELLNGFVDLVGAKTTSISKYKGYFNLTLKFNNNFEKEILYVILNYKYVDNYDSKFFDEKAKLTDEIADNFKGEVEITTTEKYNKVSNFMYTKVPQNKMTEYLMKGLKVKVNTIVFKDKTSIKIENGDWKYLD
jgi:hypothetical protein